MGVEKLLWLVLTNPTHTSLQYLQYLIYETSVIVFVICAIVMVWGKQAACKHVGQGAHCPASCPNCKGITSKAKINCFCLAGTALWSHYPNREFPAPAALTQQLAQSNRKKTKRKRSGRKAEVGARRSPILCCQSSCHGLACPAVLVLWAGPESRCWSPSITLSGFPAQLQCSLHPASPQAHPTESLLKGSLYHQNICVWMEGFYVISSTGAHGWAPRKDTRNSAWLL